MKAYEGSWSGIRPLESKIDGLGLYATDDIEINTLVGVTHHHLWKEVARTPLGGFINHSSDPNCRLVRKEKSSKSELLTIKNISNGEELTLEYKMYEVDNDTHRNER